MWSQDRTSPGEQRAAPDPEASTLRLSWSKDGGRTWTPPVTPHHDGKETQHGFASLFDLVVRYAAQIGAQPLEAVRETLGAQLTALGASALEPKREALARVLDAVERSFVEKGAPPDLTLSLASFRRWLAEP